MNETTEVKTVPIEVDGRALEVRADHPLLFSMLEAGIEVPHFCYHPGLSIAGNCRMCLVEIEGMSKLEVSCNIFPREGMVVRSEKSEAVAEAREAVMEFLLINHPLDCPVCDQAGECWLQDHAYTHGRDVGRFSEEKVHRHTKRMGDGSDVLLWGERCISCSRCVRFCEEVSGGGEITLVERGDRSVVDVHPAFPLVGPLSGNTVDICPVPTGARWRAGSRSRPGRPARGGAGARDRRAARSSRRNRNRSPRGGSR